MGLDRRPLATLVAVQIAIFVLSLPGLGLETRKPSDYAGWAGPIFLTFTILVFALGVAALVLLRSRPGVGTRLAMGQAVVAIATNVLDISHLGGPPPPTGPLVLGILSILIALGELVAAGLLVRELTPPKSAASSSAS